ncbi:MAG: hypothetical protein AABZ06_14930 [Bdellovibrionota bacterium]
MNKQINRSILYLIIAAALASNVCLATGGSNNGGSGRGSGYMAKWCNDAIGILEHYKQKAQTLLISNPKDDVVSMLESGLDKALEGYTDQNPEFSLTFRVLTRGKDIAAAVEEITRGQSSSGETRLMVLDSFYDFAIKVVSSVDSVYYIPWRYRDPDNYERIMNEQDLFEQRFAEYARKQIKWVNGAFASFDPELGATPTGDKRVYLKIAELVTLHAAEDLSDSLWAIKYGCLIQKLKLLNADLALHSSGSTLAFGGNDKIAINVTFNTLRDVTSSIKHERGSGCSI